MAKRHDEPNPNSSRNSLIVMAVGGLLVAALVGWAITRSVEPAVPESSTGAGYNETAANSTQPPGDPMSATNTAANPSSSTSTMPPLSDLPQLTPPNGIPPHEDPERNSVARIAAEDLRPKFDRGEVTIIDVRDAGSFASGHIPGAIHVPLATVEAQLSYLPKDKPIVAYCT
jgi:hypothetical protein